MFYGDVFLKNKKCLNPEFLLVNNISKDFSDLKVLITKDHSSLDYGPLNLLFHFTDS